MSWIITYEAEANTRILKGWSVTGTFTFDKRISWFTNDTKKWVSLDGDTSGGASSHAKCNSFRAFKRHLRKHKELQLDGLVMIMGNRYPGHAVFALWVNDGDEGIYDTKARSSFFNKTSFRR